MPANGPGSRYSCTATKAVKHGNPAIENRHPGVAAKSTQAPNAYPSTANALAAQNIAVGEEMVIFLDGAQEIPVSTLPASPAVGDRLYIVEADNTLTKTAGSNVKFGVISSIDTGTGRALINFNLRDSF